MRQVLQGAAKQATIGTLVDDAMDAIERNNPRLKGGRPNYVDGDRRGASLRGS